jgi:hypothetical protein
MTMATPGSALAALQPHHFGSPHRVRLAYSQTWAKIIKDSGFKAQ